MELRLTVSLKTSGTEVPVKLKHFNAQEAIDAHPSMAFSHGSESSGQQSMSSIVEVSVRKILVGSAIEPDAPAAAGRITTNSAIRTANMVLSALISGQYPSPPASVNSY